MSLGSIIGDLGGKAADAIGTAFREGMSHVASVDIGMHSTPEGSAIADDYHKIFLPTRDQLTSTLTEHAQGRAAKIDVDHKVAMAQHQDNLRKGIPSIEPKRPNTTIPIERIHAQANAGARHAWLGPKDVLGTMAAKAIEDKYGSLAAQNFVHNMDLLLHDSISPKAAVDEHGLPIPIKRGTNTAPYSQFAMNAQNAGVDLGKSGTKSAYTPDWKYQKAMQAGMYQTLSPFMAVYHLGTYMNGMYGTDPITFIRAAARSLKMGFGNDMDAYHALSASGAFAENYTKAAKAYNRFDATGRPDFTGSPLAKALYNTFHLPGFDRLRRGALLLGANTGQMTAEQAARDFAANPASKRLAWMMDEFGLDKDKMIANKGILDEEDLNKAIYSFVNKYYFLDNTLERSRLLQAHPIGRFVGAYHSFVTRQSKLMFNATFRDWKVRGSASVMRNIAITSAIFPPVGEAVHLALMTLRGQDAQDQAKQDWKAMGQGNEAAKALLQGHFEKRNAEAAAKAYFNAFSYAGPMGIYLHMAQNVAAHKTLDYLTGPIGTTADRFADDVATFTHNASTRGLHSRPTKTAGENLLRDALYSLPYISEFAQVLQHRMLPRRYDRPGKDPVMELWHHVRHEDEWGHPLDEKKEDDSSLYPSS